MARINLLAFGGCMLMLGLDGVAKPVLVLIALAALYNGVIVALALSDRENHHG